MIVAAQHKSINFSRSKQLCGEHDAMHRNESRASCKVIAYRNDRRPIEMQIAAVDVISIPRIPPHVTSTERARDVRACVSNSDPRSFSSGCWLDVARHHANADERRDVVTKILAIKPQPTHREGERERECRRRAWISRNFN